MPKDPMKKISVSQITRFHEKIWDHYRLHGRVMPWRGEHDPYKVLVSEVMLQQTQVTRVIQKYIEFIKKFPSFKKLSQAPLSDVLSLWSGLGYNRRAKFLRSISQVVVKDYKGKLPTGEQELLSLPGIGKGTVGSLQAFAFNIPSVFIETNIRRVFIHFFFHEKHNVPDSDILNLVAQSVDRDNPREWYYALMDYGAYLKILEVNPNIQSKHYVKQSVFKGSNREVRGAILKYVSKKKKETTKKLMKELGFEKNRFNTALGGLIQEGVLIVKKDIISIHDGV